ncbi:ubiquitin-like domain-containing CTD phosphatase 1 [Sphaeroforma arctica JP610]|uniref:protein-serine/threonine phosphatase n=1 Tax=Sphaeroforma arctica JP610 TaxID=667725 RepID=A0A0L0G0T1_9EUKA|nr:ubiquitin-like domain-containing CTD phosphatase 1 [Sphaeroforma arctica JP610]KNC82441.1 ubiquitin-like domain-containing CTD phosphatase 1 [Sphaeroforma arctica JP610]|eukprot:XP_014156343.1 ubiquitin-like domain-containing CTD phosphatase 1 [Sphaeroforma arctica JP610]
MEDMVSSSESVCFIIKWNGSEYPINMPGTDTVVDLKVEVAQLTGVETHRQKILGLKLNRKPAPDDAQLQTLSIKPGSKVMMMGTRPENIIVTPEENYDDNVVNDFEIDSEVVAVVERTENLQKIKRRVEQYKIDVLQVPRKGKKLLVLDVDYTLFDHRSVVESFHHLMRPYLHEFLAAAYDYYDIVIWSATGMNWVETKMRLLGVLNNPSYKISFLLCARAMISVETAKRGVVNTKALGVVWGKFPEFYNSKQTIIFDDIRRNFLMNPQNGLRIKPFRDAMVNRATDNTLKRLAKYLVLIAELDSLEDLDHRHWKQYVRDRTG